MLWDMKEAISESLDSSQFAHVILLTSSWYFKKYAVLVVSYIYC